MTVSGAGKEARHPAQLHRIFTALLSALSLPINDFNLYFHRQILEGFAQFTIHK
jgi:hypothetical protein